tara:strand:- start:1322 stop:2233 length:912 start_codon:yes stop_codon:yes gene_type:complete
MAKIDKEKKSSRLLGSRRYTHDTFLDSQEAFTNVLDLRAEEIYTEAHLVPSSSLPFSGSSQNQSTYQVGGNNIVKYWYRHKLTKSNLNNEAWFFLSPTGSNSGVGAQLINDNQKTDFISPKYALSSLANSTTEDTTPGYGVVVFKSTSTDSGSLGSSDIVSTNDYTFDYKTGILQFSSSAVDPSDSQYIYMTAYQYSGTTLRSGVDVSGNIKAEGSTTFGNATSDVHQITGSLEISGSLTVSGQTILDSYHTGSESLIVSGAMSVVDQQVSSKIASASVFIKGLGTVATTDLSGVIDLGDGFQ